MFEQYVTKQRSFKEHMVAELSNLNQQFHGATTTWINMYAREVWEVTLSQATNGNSREMCNLNVHYGATAMEMAKKIQMLMAHVE